MANRAKRAAGRRPSAASAGPQPLTPPTPTGLSDAQAATLLQAIYDSPTLSPYGCYFYLNNISVVDFLSAVGGAMETPDQPYPYNKYKTVTPVHFTLSMQCISALGASKVFTKTGQPWQVFVKLDNYQLLFPFHIASVLSISFIKGFVTRLILEAYSNKWSTIQPPFSIPALPLIPYPPPPQAQTGLTVDLWAQYYLKSLSSTFQDVKNWDHWGVQDYGQCLSNMTDASLQVAGIVTGWHAADQLIANAETATVANVWKLLNAKYTTRHLGMMVGYAFCYLSGYAKNERIALIMQGAKPSASQNGPATIPAIYNNLSNNVELLCGSGSYQKELFDMGNRFFRLVVGEFYAITQNPNYVPPPPSTSVAGALAAYQAFIVGFERGMSLGADVLFTDLYVAGWDAGEQFGYNLGYSNGFRDGYSQGYGAGWQAGYDANVNTPSTWMGGLSNIFQNLGTVLGDADKIAGQIGPILGDVKTVGTVVAAIFA